MTLRVKIRSIETPACWQADRSQAEVSGGSRLVFVRAESYRKRRKLPESRGMRSRTRTQCLHEALIFLRKKLLPEEQKRGSCQPHEPRLFSGCHEPITRESGGVPCRTQRRARSRRTHGAICGCAVASSPERLSVPTAQDHGKPQSTASRPGEFPFTKRLSALRLRNCLPALPFLAGTPGVPAEEQPTASGFAIQRLFNSALRSAWQYVTRVRRVSCLVRRLRVLLAAAYDPRSRWTCIGTDDLPGIGIRAPEHQTIRCARGAVKACSTYGVNLAAPGGASGIASAPALSTRSMPETPEQAALRFALAASPSHFVRRRCSRGGTCAESRSEIRSRKRGRKPMVKC